MRATQSADRALRAAGWKPRFGDQTHGWKNPAGEGYYLTDEALYIEWQAALKREAAQKERAESCFQSLLAMAIGTTAIIIILTVRLWTR